MFMQLVNQRRSSATGIVSGSSSAANKSLKPQTMMLGKHPKQIDTGICQFFPHTAVSSSSSPASSSSSPAAVATTTSEGAGTSKASLFLPPELWQIQTASKGKTRGDGLMDILDEMEDLLSDYRREHPTADDAVAENYVDLLEPTPFCEDGRRGGGGAAATLAVAGSDPLSSSSFPSSFLYKSLDTDSMNFLIRNLVTPPPSPPKEDTVVATMDDFDRIDCITPVEEIDVDAAFNDSLMMSGDDVLFNDNDTTGVAPMECGSTAALQNTSSVPSSFFRPGQWEERYNELLEFKKVHGHCFVPHSWEANLPLSRWVKRQRYQYKLKYDELQQQQSQSQPPSQHQGTAKRSALTYARERALEDIGFIWSTHNAVWEEKYYELHEYAKTHGHCNVPSKYPVNPKLSVWVRCQRRQYKLYYFLMKNTNNSSNNTATKSTKQEQHVRSSMTPERIAKLESLGFDFNPRNLKL